MARHCLTGMIMRLKEKLLFFTVETATIRGFSPNKSQSFITFSLSSPHLMYFFQKKATATNAAVNGKGIKYRHLNMTFIEHFIRKYLMRSHQDFSPYIHIFYRDYCHFTEHYWSRVDIGRCVNMLVKHFFSFFSSPHPRWRRRPN